MSTVEPESLFWTLQRAYRLSRREFRERLAQVDLTARQASLLMAVRANPGRGLRFASESIGADLPTCSQLASRLEARGLLRREAHPGDRRRMRLYLTDDAQALGDQVEALQQAANSRILEAIGEEAETLRTLLVRLCDRLSADEPAPAVGP